MVKMKYYTKDGDLTLKLKNDPNIITSTNYYKLDGKLTRIPNVYSSEEELFNFALACVKENHEGVTEEDVRNEWDYYMNKKLLIIDVLQILKQENSGKDLWRYTAYSRAITNINKFKGPIVSGKQAMMIKGVGKNIADKIDDVLNAGTMQENLRK